MLHLGEITQPLYCRAWGRRRRLWLRSGAGEQLQGCSWGAGHGPSLPPPAEGERFCRSCWVTGWFVPAKSWCRHLELVLAVPSEVLLWHPSSGRREQPLRWNLRLRSVETGSRSIGRALGNPCTLPAACLLFLFALSAGKGVHLPLSKMHLNWNCRIFQLSRHRGVEQYLIALLQY